MVSDHNAGNAVGVSLVVALWTRQCHWSVEKIHHNNCRQGLRGCKSEGSMLPTIARVTLSNGYVEGPYDYCFASCVRWTIFKPHGNKNNEVLQITRLINLENVFI
jgi:hypothetical protein